MTTGIVALQILLPLALLAWLATAPATGWAAYALHVGATAVVLLALRLVAMWAMPPWWLPWAYALGLVAIVAWQVVTGRVEASVLWSTAWPGSAVLIVLAALAVYGGYAATRAVQGSQSLHVETVDIAAPFGPGTYIVAHGGSTEMVNAHLHTLDPSVERFRPWRGQSRALDVLKITPLGSRAEGWRPVDPARYETFGAKVVAPCAGTVALAQNGLPDMPVPVMDSDNKLGNFVAIDCGAFAVFLAHLRRGSVLVTAGQTVAVGRSARRGRQLRQQLGAAPAHPRAARHTRGRTGRGRAPRPHHRRALPRPQRPADRARNMTWCEHAGGGRAQRREATVAETSSTD